MEGIAKEMLGSCQEVYKRLGDEESKRIYFDRLMHSISGDYKYILDIFKDFHETKWLEEQLGKPGDKYIFGCGYYGNRIFTDTRNVAWKGYIDNNQSLWGGVKNNLPIYNPNDVPRDAVIFIGVIHYQSEIRHQLLELGFAEENIINYGKVIFDLVKKQYFDLPYLSHVEDEVFVDAGVLNGFSSQEFVKWAGDKFLHIYCFEPDKKNFPKCESNLADLIAQQKLTIIPKGVWDKAERLSFSSSGDGASHVGEGDDYIDVVTLDEALAGKKVTFIKMDIEGSEKRALMGARKIISEQHPKLAISIYHKYEDIVELPELIMSYYPEYKFYLRHYDLNNCETVLYAIP